MRLNYIDNIDCLEGLKEIPDKSVDLIVTDPPYTSPVKNAFGRGIVHRLSDLSLQEFYFNELRKEFERVLSPNGRVCIFCDTSYFAVLFGLFYHWNNKASIVWDKGRIGMGNPVRLRHEFIFYAGLDSFTPCKDTRTHIPSVIQCPAEKGFHPAQKPLQLVEQLVTCLAFPGDVVLDPFMGSGTTAVACLRTGRNYIGFELDEKYHAIAQQRIADTVDGLLGETET